MTIEIMETHINEELSVRHAEIIITNGAESYLLGIGGLPLTGNLQTILGSREAELWSLAQTKGKLVDLYELTIKRVMKAFALVVLDEINILRQTLTVGLPPRTASQIETAIKNKLKSM